MSHQRPDNEQLDGMLYGGLYHHVTHPDPHPQYAIVAPSQQRGIVPTNSRSTAVTFPLTPTIIHTCPPKKRQMVVAFTVYNPAGTSTVATVYRVQSPGSEAVTNKFVERTVGATSVLGLFPGLILEPGDSISCAASQAGLTGLLGVSEWEESMPGVLRLGATQVGTSFVDLWTCPTGAHARNLTVGGSGSTILHNLTGSTNTVHLALNRDGTDYVYGVSGISSLNNAGGSLIPFNMEEGDVLRIKGSQATGLNVSFGLRVWDA